MNYRHPVLAIIVLVLVTCSVSHSQIDETTRQVSHDIFKQLIDINTTDSVGSVTDAATRHSRSAPVARAAFQSMNP